MEITLLYFEGCPHWRVADEHLRMLSAEHPQFEISYRRVETPEEAEDLGFLGSPSIHLDGADVFSDPGAQVGLACRVYMTPDGPAGSPTPEQLRRAISDA